MRVGHTCGSAQLMAPPVKGRPLSFRGPFKGSGPGAFMLSREGAATIGIGVGLAASPSHTTVHTGPYTAVR